MDRYYKNMGMDAPCDINWEFIARLFYIGKIYRQKIPMYANIRLFVYADNEDDAKIIF